MAAIEVRDLHKNFRIPHELHTTLVERVLSSFRPVTFESFAALKGVSLSIEKGAFVGVIGGNGCGKSTLLKIMSGLIVPDRGEVRVDGSMSALLELGLGFSPELTVYENVELYAAVLGYPRAEVRKRVDEAIDFAGLDRFRDAKLKNLSTGMTARLGFATALQADSDIILLDEILAVGDADFQMKCLDVFKGFKQRRKTIVLVSHDLAQIERFCDHAIWLDRGRIAAEGKPDQVVFEYLETVGQAPKARTETPPNRQGDGRIRMLRGWLEDEEGRELERVRSGQRSAAVVQFEINEKTEGPEFGLTVVGWEGEVLYSINTNWIGLRTEDLHAGQLLEMRVPFTAALRDGQYSLQVGIGPRHMRSFHDLVFGAINFVVYGSSCRMGIVDLQGEVSYRILPAQSHSAGDGAGPSQYGGGSR